AYCAPPPVGVTKMSPGPDPGAAVSTVTGGGVVGAAAATGAPTSGDMAPTRMAPARAARRRSGARPLDPDELDTAIPFHESISACPPGRPVAAPPARAAGALAFPGDAGAASPAAAPPTATPPWSDADDVSRG